MFSSLLCLCLNIHCGYYLLGNTTCNVHAYINDVGKYSSFYTWKMLIWKTRGVPADRRAANSPPEVSQSPAPKHSFHSLPWKRHLQERHGYSRHREDSVGIHPGHRSVLQRFVNTLFHLGPIPSLWFLSHSTIMIHYAINYFKTKG